jgi:hypothetical protein
LGEIVAMAIGRFGLYVRAAFAIRGHFPLHHTVSARRIDGIRRARTVIDQIEAHRPASGWLFNVNVPDLESNKIRGVRTVPPARPRLFLVAPAL